jgi:transcriptional regulator
MYQPAHAKFIERSQESLYRLIRDNSLGTLVTSNGEVSDANHVPFLVDSAPPGKLMAHVPRANPVWKSLADRAVLVIFQGPNAYISPSWYASKREHGKVVPTWNYAIVHVRGKARVIEDRVWLRNHLEQMTTTHESKFAHPWKISDAPAEYVEQLLGSIVGIEIDILGLEGKFKLGQNRPEADQLGVARELERVQPALAQLTRERLPK